MGQILGKIAKMVKPGVSTAELEDAAEKMIREAGGRPSFRGYHTRGATAYPTALCTSINEEVVHGIPSERTVHAGDVVSIDAGAVVSGFYADAATTVAAVSLW